MPALSEPHTGDTLAASVPPQASLRRGRAARLAWIALGLLLVGVAFVGILVPLLPTTDFLLLALACFARSSTRLEAWLLTHPRFGPSLRAWRLQRAVPRKAKIAAAVDMTIGYVIFWLHLRPDWPLSLGVALFLLFWAVWIARRPEPSATL